MEAASRGYGGRLAKQQAESAGGAGETARGNSYHVSRFVSSAAIILFCSIAAIVSACTHATPDATWPKNRIEYFITNIFPHMSSETKYQNFIAGELGSKFTEDDFVGYMTENGSECSRDAANDTVYCMYITFGRGIDLSDPWKSADYSNFWCFWSIPPVDRPTVRFRFSGSYIGIGRDFPGQSQHDFAEKHHVPSCRTLLLKMYGAEK